MMAYVLGVDGGNTKTDYLLYDLEGHLIRHLRAGTCSHEVLGMEGARREMDARAQALLSGAGAAQGDVVAAAFGLAGIDQAVQQAALSAIIKEMGFSNSTAMNDSFLGIKAGSENGIGVCSINGTGTAAGGIDASGRWIQVGGFGQVISGDEAGGSYIAARTLRAAYDEIFRFGASTSLTPALLALFACGTPDDLHQAISTMYMYGKAIRALDIIQVLFGAADAGDAVAMRIVQDVADALARSAAGCAMRLRFDGPIPLVLIGSVWTKGRYQPMIDHFAAQFEAYAGQKAAPAILDVPPAVGSVLWALELATGHVPTGTLRARVFAQAKDL